MKSISKLYQNNLKKPLQNLSKNLLKINSNIIEKSIQKPLQKPLQNLSKDLSKTIGFWDPKKLSFAYIYIYSILGQPGLTLEREARLMGEIILR